MNTLTLKDGEIRLNGTKINRVSRIDINKIDTDFSMEVTIFLNVDEVDVRYSPERDSGFKQTE